MKIYLSFSQKILLVIKGSLFNQSVLLKIFRAEHKLILIDRQFHNALLGCLLAFLQGTPERLLDHLMEDHSVIDPTYVEDFLLTFVVFFNKSHDIATKLLKWFERPQLKDKVDILFMYCK